MITTADIGDIIYRDCGVFGIDDIRREWHIPRGEVLSEKIVIIPKTQSADTYWKKGFVEVNLCVPDLRGSAANLVRMAELERKAVEAMDGVTGIYDGTPYYYYIDSTGTEADTALKCHFVNVKLMFQVLNVN